MEDNKKIMGVLASALGEYISMQTDGFKKNIVTGLSVGFSMVLTILVITMLLLIVLGVFAFAFILLLGGLIDSMSGAAFIVGGVYLVVIVVLVLLRKRLFLNMFTDLFAGIIQTDKTTDNWKSLLLAIVRNLRNTLDA